VVQHINQVIEGGSRVFSAPRTATEAPDAIVVCAGIGARMLGGIEDKTVYPVRGQTVLLRAPWVRFGRATSTDGLCMTYIIPRRSGGVRFQLPLSDRWLTME